MYKECDLNCKEKLSAKKIKNKIENKTRMMKQGIECSEVVVEKAAKAIRRNNEKAQNVTESEKQLCMVML